MLCQTIKKQSISTWKTLLEADALACKVGEESITDFLILELAKGAALGGYSVKAFTKPQESLNGADWELWLTGPSKTWIGYRIQAKVFDIATLSYKYLHHGSAGGLTQAQKLIAGAATVSAVPLYVLYSAWHSTSGAPTWNCGTYSQDNRLWGLAAVSAAQVSAIAPTKTLTAISAHMRPFHCLFCCGGYGGHDLPTRSHRFARARFSPDANLRQSPPPHVQGLLGQYPVREMDDTSWGNFPEDLGRVVVLAESDVR